MKIEKVYPAGWKMITDEDTYYFGEYGQFGCYCNEGVIYKDEEAFKTGIGVCYINEYGFDCADDGDLFSFIDKAINETELEGNPYVTNCGGYTRADLVALCNGNEEIAEDLFDHLDWMAAETLWYEWLEDEEFLREIDGEIKTTKNFKECQEVINELSIVDIVKTIDYFHMLQNLLPDTNEVLDDFDDILKPLNDVAFACRTDKQCPHCGCYLFKSDLPQYDYVCAECNENFYECEVK